MNTAVGKSVRRKDAWDKVTGKAKYTDDLPDAGILAARLLTSTCAHARINNIDVSGALGLSGVKAVLTGKDCPELLGPLLQDRPALAGDAVRYAGEPVALVVAIDNPTAENALRLIRIEYEPLPFVITPSQAMAEGAPLVHERVSEYKKVLADIYPEAGTNIASRYSMRKGNMEEAWKRCSAIVEQRLQSAAVRSPCNGNKNGKGSNFFRRRCAHYCLLSGSLFRSKAACRSIFNSFR